MFATVFAVQLYDFQSEEGPASVAFHPNEQIFACGFNSGTIRVFDVASAKLLAEHEYVANRRAASALPLQTHIPRCACFIPQESL